MLYLHDIIPCTTVLGPGKRFAVWFQGCKKRCPDCINPEGQSLHQNGFFMSVEELLSRIVHAASDLTGITVSGGEPLLQFEELFSLIAAVRQNTSLDVMLFTGFRLEEIPGIAGEHTEQFLSMIDILIDGEYQEELNHNEMFRGSANQNLYFFTGKYLPFAEKIENAHNRSIEWHSRPDSAFYMVGIPPKGFRETLRQELTDFEERN